MTVFTLMPSLVPAVTFSLYIWFGTKLNLAEAVAALSYFDRMIWSISWFPNFLTQRGNLNVAFSRI
jgi:prepilin signal peptidase PulO-like enzyme (type II secretory pathway)